MIHSSVVSSMPAMPWLETTLSGSAAPQPRIAQLLPSVMRHRDLDQADRSGCRKAMGDSELPGSQFAGGLRAVAKLRLGSEAVDHPAGDVAAHAVDARIPFGRDDHSIDHDAGETITESLEFGPTSSSSARTSSSSALGLPEVPLNLGEPGCVMQQARRCTRG